MVIGRFTSKGSKKPKKKKKVAKKKTLSAEEISRKEGQLRRIRKELRIDRDIPSEVSLNMHKKVEFLEKELETALGPKFDARNYFKGGGAVNAPKTKKSCKIALRGFGKVIK